MPYVGNVERLALHLEGWGSDPPDDACKDHQAAFPDWYPGYYQDMEGGGGGGGGAASPLPAGWAITAGDKAEIRSVQQQIHTDGGGSGPAPAVAYHTVSGPAHTVYVRVHDGQVHITADKAGAQPVKGIPSGAEFAPNLAQWDPNGDGAYEASPRLTYTNPEETSFWHFDADWWGWGGSLSDIPSDTPTTLYLQGDSNDNIGAPGPVVQLDPATGHWIIVSGTPIEGENYVKDENGDGVPDKDSGGQDMWGVAYSTRWYDMGLEKVTIPHAVNSPELSDGGSTGSTDVFDALFPDKATTEAMPGWQYTVMPDGEVKVEGPVFLINDPTGARTLDPNNWVWMNFSKIPGVNGLRSSGGTPQPVNIAASIGDYFGTLIGGVVTTVMKVTFLQDDYQLLKNSTVLPDSLIQTFPPALRPTT